MFFLARLSSKMTCSFSSGLYFMIFYFSDVFPYIFVFETLSFCYYFLYICSGCGFRPGRKILRKSLKIHQIWSNVLHDKRSFFCPQIACCVFALKRLSTLHLAINQLEACYYGKWYRQINKKNIFARTQHQNFLQWALVSGSPKMNLKHGPWTVDHAEPLSFNQIWSEKP